MFKLNFHPQPMYGCMTQKFISRVNDGDQLKVIPLPAEKAYPPQPPCENFTLDARLRAGVPLTEVNCELLDVSEKVTNDQLSQLQEDFDKLDSQES